MIVLRWWNALSLFWKLYLLLSLFMALVIGLGEAVLEDPLENFLFAYSGGKRVWHEFVLWGVSILVPALIAGFFAARALTGRLDRMAGLAGALARGRLQARMPVTGNDKDPFDLLARNFNSMALSVENLLGNERRLLADISHELRSPLTRMQIALALLERKREAGDPAADLTARLTRDVEHMSELVSTLLGQARDRLDSPDGSEDFDLSELLTPLVEDFAFQAEPAGKTLILSLNGALPLHGSMQQLRSLFGNVLANAVTYSPAGEQIVVTAGRSARPGSSENEAALVSIRDFGPGVPDDQLEDIFRIFYRMDSSRARTSGGVGLGLAMAREAALRHGGSIEAHNAHPGLEVRIRLPLAPQPDGAKP